MLFIDAEGTPEQLSKATGELTAIGYLQCDEEDRSVVLLEFKLKDEPGSVTSVLDYEHHIAFTGDIFVNLKDMTPRQLQYNTYAPILMTSVDTDKDLCTEERQALFQRLGTGSWQIFGGHGGKKEYNV